jgi:hypothetical protein
MNLPALKGWAFCKRRIVYEVRRTFGSTVRKLCNGDGLRNKSDYCHFLLAALILTALKAQTSLRRGITPHCE